MTRCGSGKAGRQAGRQARPQLALLDFTNAQISRVASLGTSCRTVRVPLSHVFLLFPFPSSVYSFVSSSLAFRLLAARFYVRRHSFDSLCRSHLPPLLPLCSSSIYLYLVDRRPSHTVLLSANTTRVSLHCVYPTCLYFRLGHVHQPPTFMLVFSRSRRTYATRLLLDARPRNTERIRVRSKASAATNAPNARWSWRPIPSRAEYHTCQTQRTRVKPSIASVRGAGTATT